MNYCPACGYEGPHTLLGQLGHLTWLRCRSCGIDFNVKGDVPLR